MSDMPREEVERLMRKSGMSFHLGMPHDSVITQMIRFSSMLRDEILEASEHVLLSARWSLSARRVRRCVMT